MMRIRITMDWTPPIWMDAETAKKEAIRLAKDSGFCNPLPTVGEAVKGNPRNWWRELVVQTYTDASYAWEAERERATMMYETEMREWEAENPRPTLAETMRGLKGVSA